MALNLVLFEPEIPNNTGNIGRLSLASGCHLHLVKPFGFELSDKRVKRAGLDYWQYLSLTIYESIEDFYVQHQDKNLVYFSSHGEKTHWEIPFEEGMFLIFGKESVGLPKDIIQKNEDKVYKIPLYSEHIRSLNVSNAVAIVVYEGLRQLHL
ncbi:tRNA (cytidine(34)-2'-O)-methyltransferase [Cellulophaga sp. Hel_I_12]|uniref:tRNA (cytidine(34)-2'-O)-methyltransferase n=1 Tax=Cellulophaga sp. Hel_I_12 TaxID=1249972 RepID=UPI000647DB08|nr:tRNA (cytidine(34)-2'-O)-methyltransferase [Cellulophaga sp. Hel_I_12]